MAGPASDLPARLRMARSRALLDAVKSAIEHGSADQVESALRTAKSLLGGKDVSAVLTDVIVGRIDGSLDHAEASQHLEQLAARADARGLRPLQWFVLEHLSRAIGCFVASLAFGDSGRQAVLEGRGKRDHPSVFLAHLYNHDVDSAVAVWDQQNTDEADGEAWTDAGQLLWLLTAGEHGRRDIAPTGSWRDALEGRTILALGPAPTSLPSSGWSNALVARVATPGVTGWPDADVVGGRVDLTYANSDSAKWFVANNERQLFDRVEFASFRTSVWQQLGLANGRTAYHHKRLLPMPFDKTNMVPLIAWDVLHVPDVSLHIAGTTFFASATAYTLQDVRLKEERGGHTDQRGSTGIRFERCVSFSGHHLSAHHTLMALLARAGVVSFDDDGQRVLELSTREYLADIDRLYGVDAV